MKKKIRWGILGIGVLCALFFLLREPTSGALALDGQTFYISLDALANNMTSINANNELQVEPATPIIASRFKIDTSKFDAYTITPCSTNFSGCIVIAVPQHQERMEVSTLDIRVGWFDRQYIQKQYDLPFTEDKYMAVIDFNNDDIYADLLMVSGNDLDICKSRIIQLANRLQHYSGPFE